MKILKNEAADQQDRHGDVQNGDPEPECGQPGATRGGAPLLSDNGGSFGPKQTRKNPF
jgi:hypothetical protein